MESVSSLSDFITKILMAMAKEKEAKLFEYTLKQNYIREKEYKPTEKIKLTEDEAKPLIDLGIILPKEASEKEG